MAKSFPVNICAPYGSFYEGPCQSLTVPVSDGRIGIMAGFANSVVALIPGVIHIKLESGEMLYGYISSGFLKSEHGQVLLMADHIEKRDGPERRFSE